MTSLTLSILLQATLVAAAPQAPASQYTIAYRQSEQTGQPLVVLVGAEWCPGCVTMKSSVIPQLKRRGVLSRVAFAHVNTDREQSLAGKLMSGGAIPQLLMYYRTADGWQRRQLTGAQSVQAVESFLDEGVRGTRLAKRASQTTPVE